MRREKLREEMEEGSERGHPMEREKMRMIVMERNEKEDAEERRDRERILR